MVRVVGSHHFADVINSLPMYPHLKKHIPGRCDQQSRNWPRQVSPTPGTSYSANIPHLSELNQNIIDDNLARRAIGALRNPGETGTDSRDGWTDELSTENEATQYHSQQWDRDALEESQNNDIEMFDNDIRQRQTYCEQSTAHDGCAHRWHDSSMTEEEDDSVAGEAQSDMTTERKTRRRQRNKLSAQAYRLRKRSKTQEQEQVLANLEAENSYLMNSLQKLEEEKRQFLEYLRTDMNIDLNKDSTGDLYMTHSVL